MLAPCPGCGALVPDEDGPVHDYIASSPGCWRTFGEVQADEFARFGYPHAAHRLVVDAYAAQHPGDGTDRRDRRSVFGHLVALCALIERDVAATHVTALLRKGVQKGDAVPLLRRDGGPGELTVLHVVGARDLEDYERRAREWAEAVWRSWEGSHPQIHAVLAAVL